jgi:hypothetical protein
VIACDPAVSVAIVIEADVPLMVAMPIEVVPSKNWTVPVGVPLFPLTVAANVRVWPTVAGFTEETSDVTEVAGLVVGGPYTLIFAAVIAEITSP